jgi:hypothetical protein
MSFKLKAHDRKPSIQVTLGFVGSSTVPDLAGASVSFIMRLTGSSGAPKVNSPAVIVDAGTGVIRYDWAVGDTDTPGEYEAEWEVIGSDGLAQTFPTDAYNTVIIYADLDNA